MVIRKIQRTVSKKHIFIFQVASIVRIKQRVLILSTRIVNEGEKALSYYFCSAKNCPCVRTRLQKKKNEFYFFGDVFVVNQVIAKRTAEWNASNIGISCMKGCCIYFHFH